MRTPLQLAALITLLIFTLHSAIAQAETYYFHNDHLGTPQVLTDQYQAVVWQAEYDPFGKATETVATVEQNLRFPGQYLERETGLHYNYFRDYDPAIGRYLQSDPIGLGGGINTFGYAYQNPTIYTDPTGEFVPAVIWAIRGLSAAYAAFEVAASAYEAYSTVQTVLDPCVAGYDKAVGIGLFAAGILLPGNLGLLDDVAKKADDYVDLASPQRRKHILNGDATGGGHRPGTGKQGKSEFPQGWSDNKIMHEISDVATDPTSVTRAGRGGRTITEGTRNGVDIRVIQERNGDIVSGFPTNVPRSPR
jgi:RHS repeat-associated protein